MEPIECNQSIAGIVKNNKTGNVISNAQIQLFSGDKLIEKVTSNEKGAFRFEKALKCKSSITISTTHTDYDPKTYTVNLDTKDLKKNSIIIELIKIEVVEKFITEKGVIVIKTDPINFDLNKSEIREDAAIELNKVVKIMKENPTIKVELNSHTDSRAPDNYNMRLSNERAASSINYIISQGINASRISGRGYGETRLLNKCSNGVKCSNTEHEQNRRTEFIVIEK